jgi:hypothetical protein
MFAKRTARSLNQVFQKSHELLWIEKGVSKKLFLKSMFFIVGVPTLYIATVYAIYVPPKIIREESEKMRNKVASYEERFSKLE